VLPLPETDCEPVEVVPKGVPVGGAVVCVAVGRLSVAEWDMTPVSAACVIQSDSVVAGQPIAAISLLCTEFRPDAFHFPAILTCAGSNFSTPAVITIGSWWAAR
jgi:hypothetical protein